MKSRNFLFSFFIVIMGGIHCVSQKKLSFTPKVVYQSAHLIITQLTENSFLHTSFKQTNDFGNVPCNGVVVSNQLEAIVFDTPTNDQSANELIHWIQDSTHCKINAIIPTHFHDDCLGGLKAFDNKKIPSYAFYKTIELAKENNLTVPQHGFKDSLILKIGSEYIIAKFLGEGHTKDNIVGYFPKENLLFGGCLIKELGASKGYLGDANITAWSNTVQKVKASFPKATLIIPGHGQYGNKTLLDYTIKLFQLN